MTQEALSDPSLDLGRSTEMRPWWRRLLCWGRCPCRHYEDDGGCGGQCVRCGRIVGYVTRAELRAFADREIARHTGPSSGD